MEVKFHGAADSVTGSCHLLSINGKNVLLDCGLYQGKDEKENGNEFFPFNPKEIDVIILSHSHIDHSGRIPLLYKQGFKGKVICTDATLELCGVMLVDSGHIQEMEIEWKNRKRIRQGLEPIEPLYTAKIAELAMYLFNGYPYDELVEVFEGLKIRFRDAGHLLGSAIVELFIKEDGKEQLKLVFTGDLGNKNLPLVKDPTLIESADYVIMETTYGDRVHEAAENELNQFASIIKKTIKRGGNVIIPSFAVGRAQEVLYTLNKFVENKELKNISFYVDSPLAAEATEIHKKYMEYYDEETHELVKEGDNPLEFDGLMFTKSPEDSAKVNKIQSGAVVISASGMCEAGRIKHHLKHNLWRKECSVIFVGYQAEGTLGRAIVEGAKKVKLFGEEIAVNAEIHVLHGLSGHADREGLFHWINSFKVKPKKVFLVHGDEEARRSFKELLKTNKINAHTVHKNDKYFIFGGDSEGTELQEDRIIETPSTTRNRKEKILNMLSNLENIENMSRDELLKELSKVIG